VPEHNDRALNLYNLLHYIKITQERKPSEHNQRNLTSICNRCGLHPTNTGKPLIIECVTNNLLIERLNEEEGNNYRYYELTKNGIEAHDHLKNLYKLIWSDKAGRLTEWYDK